MVYVRNPKTGRLIKKGGTTWQKVFGKKKRAARVKRGVRRIPRQKPPKRRGRRRARLPDPLLFPSFYEDPLYPLLYSKPVAVITKPSPPKKKVKIVEKIAPLKIKKPEEGVLQVKIGEPVAKRSISAPALNARARKYKRKKTYKKPKKYRKR